MEQSSLVNQLIRDKLFGAAIVFAPIVLWGLFELMPEARSYRTESVNALLMLIVVGPVLEELAFRGWIQGEFLKTRLRRYSFVGITGQNFVTTQIFGLFHLVSHTWIWSAAVILPSLIFGLFKDRYRSAIPAVVLHIYYNALYFGLP